MPPASTPALASAHVSSRHATVMYWLSPVGSPAEILPFSAISEERKTCSHTAFRATVSKVFTARAKNDISVQDLMGCKAITFYFQRCMLVN